MEDTISLTINGRETSVNTGTTILEAAALLGIEIPTICYHDHLSAYGLCRLCSVDVGGRLQAAACVTPCANNMEVETQSGNVIIARRTILELLESAVNLEEAPEIQALVAEYNADSSKYDGGVVRDDSVYDDNPFYIRDYSQCVNCWRCVQVCADDAQFAYALNFDGRGFDTRIGTFMGDRLTNTTCVFCGQCVGVCPTGALKPKRQALLEQGMNPEEVFFNTRGSRRRKRE